MLKNVLIPISFKESQEKFITMINFLKDVGADEAILLHIGATKGRSGEHQKRKLENYAESAKSEGYKIRIIQKSGSVAREIVQTAEEEKCDFIAISSKKKNFLTRTILGTLVKDVIRQSRTPIFVYKNSVLRRSPNELSTVIYTVSLKGPDDTILPYIRNNDFHADKIAFLHVGTRAPDPVVENERLNKADIILKDLAKNCGLNEEDVQRISLIGSPRRKIVSTARQLPADLIILGKADATAKGPEPVLGSTAEEVSYNAPCSVMIIPIRRIEQ